jgi:phosphoenolpyruvate carboxylase
MARHPIRRGFLEGWHRHTDELWPALDRATAGEPWPVAAWTHQLEDQAMAVRAGGAEPMVPPPGLTPASAAVLARYMAHRLRLQNLAEALHRMERVGVRRLSDQAPPRMSYEGLMQRLRSEPSAPRARMLTASQLVLTSHPTESTRRTVLQHVRRLARHLENQPADRIARQLWREDLDALVRMLWETPSQRSERPSVLDEVDLGLWYVRESLFTAIPAVTRRLGRVVGEIGLEPPRWTLGSWIGGDRDGHPGVDAQVTRTTLIRHLETARGLYLSELEHLETELTEGRDRLADAPRLEAWMTATAGVFPREAAELSRRYPLEPARQAVGLIRARLAAITLSPPADAEAAGLSFPEPGDGYAEAAEFLQDLERLAECSATGAKAVHPSLAGLIEQARVFGFHLAALDIRQHGRVHRAAAAEMLGACIDALSPADRLKAVAEAIASPPPWEPRDPSPGT